MNTALTIWILRVCIGVSWGGCGAGGSYIFPDEQSCQRALKTMVTGDQPTAESGKKRNTVAFCYPTTRDKYPGAQ